MKVAVTAEHIKLGTPGNSYSCPVALAVSEALGGRGIVTATPFQIKHITRDFTRETSTPDEVGEFIRSFDSRKPVAPFDFELPMWHARRNRGK